MGRSKLTRNVFEALAVIARADGKVEADELAALVRAARDEGLSEEDLGAIEVAASHADGAPALDWSALGDRDRLFTYAMAYWVSRVDGEMSEEEDAALGAELGLKDDARMAAEALVDEVAALPEGARPARYDLARLRAAIDARLT